MHVDLNGLRVIVTAGAAGIGLAAAEIFVAGGANVWVCDVDRQALARLNGSGIRTAPANVGDTAEVDAFMTEAIEAMGGLDVLVNNAGVAGPGGPLESIDPTDVTRTLDIDVTSMFRTTRHAIPAMKAQSHGSIVNISSTAGQFGFPNRSAYAAAKWAVIGLTKTMAMELGEFGIRCNAICPGSIDGPRMERVVELEATATGRSPDQVRAGFERQASMRTFIDANEIAQTICFLASPLGSKISGQAIAVDGNTETLRNN